MRFIPLHSIFAPWSILLALVYCVFSVNHLQATEYTVLQNIHIGWNYDNSPGISWSGFRLYQDDRIICSTTDPTDRQMDCEFYSPFGTFSFYLAAYSETNESPLSAPFFFTLKDNHLSPQLGDAIKILQVLVNITPSELGYLDINENNKADMGDVIAVLQALL